MVDLLTVSWDDEVASCPQGGRRTDSPLSSTFIFLTEHCTDEEVEPGGLGTSKLKLMYFFNIKNANKQTNKPEEPDVFLGGCD